MPTTLVPHDPAWPTVRATDSAAPYRPDAEPAAELRRQVEAYGLLGLARTLGLSEGDVAQAADLLRPLLPVEDTTPSFLLVLAPEGVDVNPLVPGMRRAGRKGEARGVSVIGSEEAVGYRAIEGLEVPGAPYLLVDVDPGTEFVSRTPQEALGVIRDRRRTPLTMTEGVLLAAIRPDLLRPNACWSLAGSRPPNQRVPAVWISEDRPKLGWCWDRNPHTWLGTASARARLSA